LVGVKVSVGVSDGVNVGVKVWVGIGVKVGVSVGVNVAVGGKAVLVAVGVGPLSPMVKESITVPWVQLISFVPPPAGPQTNSP